ncbi:thiamine pyrophosphate-binding protein [Streptomyces sp. RTd22]|uniref:thiamine pyrophosphate-binding protein n=1 Tax=Streptomyces sp. RTd22 TaxID=1841249 RepID=UPI0007C44D0C|nr:thiamine pyrophosphate-binding protein [Streptomyces sp. RTd22]
MLFHEATARALSDLGVTTVFGVLGDANLYVMDAFQRHTGGTFVSMANESGAVLAANGYARTSGRPGVATVTHGPALTNTVTALVEGVRDRTPLLLIAGDTAVADRENFQNISQRDVVMPTGAGFEQVRTPATLAEDLTTALRRAVLERRPVVLNMPVDFQWEQVAYAPLTPTWPAPQAVPPDPAVMDRAVGVVASAERPVVLAGQGAMTPDARTALLRLASRIGAPVATTLRARDLFRGEPYDLGIFGTLSDRYALDTMTRSDCVVAFGASLNKWTTAEGSLLEGKKLVHVDADRLALARHSAVHVGVVGDATAVADGLVAWLDEAEVKPTGFASPKLAERLTARTRQEFPDRGTDSTVDIRTALMRLESAFPEERTLVLDGGRFIHHAFRLLRVPEPRAYVHTVNFGSIGLGMGNAVGAALGAPGRPTLLVTGDGGFMLGGLAEFGSAVRHGLDLVVVVLNDGAYGAEHIQLRNKGMDPAISTFVWPDLGPVATALGGQGLTVRNRAELDEALAAIAHRDRPVLIDVRIDPDAVPAPDY